MMPRYIDADALIESIKNELWDWDSLDGITSATVLKQTITDIQNAATADVVERDHEITYMDCANAMMKMWIDKVVTDFEYNKIMDRLNAHEAKREGRDDGEIH